MSVAGHRVGKKLNKYHKKIEEERQSTETVFLSSIDQPQKKSSRYKSTTTTTNTQTISSLEYPSSSSSSSKPSVEMAHPKNTNSPFSKLTQFVHEEDLAISPNFSQSFNSKPKISYSNSLTKDSDSDSDNNDLLKRSTQIISKIERHTRSPNHSRLSSPVSPRSSRSPSRSFKSNSSGNEKDLLLSDLDDPPFSKSVPPSKRAGSPLDSFKTGISTIFSANANKRSPRSQSINRFSEKVPESSIPLPERHSPNFIMSDGSYDSPTQKFLESRSSRNSSVEIGESSRGLTFGKSNFSFNSRSGISSPGKYSSSNLNNSKYNRSLRASSPTIPSANRISSPVFKSTMNNNANNNNNNSNKTTNVYSHKPFEFTKKSTYAPKYSQNFNRSRSPSSPATTISSTSTPTTSPSKSPSLTTKSETNRYFSPSTTNKNDKYSSLNHLSPATSPNRYSNNNTIKTTIPVNSINKTSPSNSTKQTANFDKNYSNNVFNSFVNSKDSSNSYKKLTDSKFGLDSSSSTSSSSNNNNLYSNKNKNTNKNNNEIATAKYSFAKHVDKPSSDSDSNNHNFSQFSKNRYSVAPIQQKPISYGKKEVNPAASVPVAAETKLTKKFSKKLTNLFSPNNSKNKNYSSSSSSSSEHFLFKPKANYMLDQNNSSINKSSFNSSSKQNVSSLNIDSETESESEGETGSNIPIKKPVSTTKSILESSSDEEDNKKSQFHQKQRTTPTFSLKSHTKDSTKSKPTSTLGNTNFNMDNSTSDTSDFEANFVSTNKLKPTSPASTKTENNYDYRKSTIESINKSKISDSKFNASSSSSLSTSDIKGASPSAPKRENESPFSSKTKSNMFENKSKNKTNIIENSESSDSLNDDFKVPKFSFSKKEIGSKLQSSSASSDFDENPKKTVNSEKKNSFNKNFSTPSISSTNKRTSPNINESSSSSPINSSINSPKPVVRYSPKKSYNKNDYQNSSIIDSFDKTIDSFEIDTKNKNKNKNDNLIDQIVEEPAQQLIKTKYSYKKVSSTISMKSGSGSPKEEKSIFEQEFETREKIVPSSPYEKPQIAELPYKKHSKNSKSSSPSSRSEVKKAKSKGSPTFSPPKIRKSESESEADEMLAVLNASIRANDTLLNSEFC